jgi:hypothetical protein
MKRSAPDGNESLTEKLFLIIKSDKQEAPL